MHDAGPPGQPAHRPMPSPGSKTKMGWQRIRGSRGSPTLDGDRVGCVGPVHSDSLEPGVDGIVGFKATQRGKRRQHSRRLQAPPCMQLFSSHTFTLPLAALFSDCGENAMPDEKREERKGKGGEAQNGGRCGGIVRPVSQDSRSCQLPETLEGGEGALRDKRMTKLGKESKKKRTHRPKM